MSEAVGGGGGGGGAALGTDTDLLHYEGNSGTPRFWLISVWLCLLCLLKRTSHSMVHSSTLGRTVM